MECHESGYMHQTWKLLPTRVLLPLLFSSLKPYPSTSFFTHQPLPTSYCYYQTKAMGGNLETRSLLDELRSFDNGGFCDLGHPLLNRVADSFLKAASIGAIKAVAREGCRLTLEGNWSTTSSDLDASGAKNDKKHPFPHLRGETNKKSLEAMVKSTGKESLEWGLAAGLYSGITYGLQEARGTHDWCRCGGTYGDDSGTHMREWFP
ncbi:outer envelope pore protein 16-2, chloroplastic-like isoform X2 [Hibiscus syriacus]|nr:outer envelope pore protein 16-2, chloroplastic-like isoform X2 [Hibiscus syriacus]